MGCGYDVADVSAWVCGYYADANVVRGLLCVRSSGSGGSGDYYGDVMVIGECVGVGAE